MRILLIHTAGSEGIAALANTELATGLDEGPGDAVVEAEVLPGRTSLERLVPAVRRLMEAHGWRLRELAAIVVVTGPGSFTGVRVGLSAAKGWSEAGSVPLIAVSRLALLAACIDGGQAPVYAVLDAGRGEFFFGEYVGHRCVREVLTGMEDVVAAAGSGVVVVCEMKVAEALAGLGPVMVDEPSARDALSFARERIEAGEFDDAATLDANYLRRTDAEIFLNPAAPKAAR
jgi:tRNA threonylcarbamoyladenosine biosynthesis protein TsaB